MEWFERKCRFGPSFRNPSAGSWCGTSSRLAGLLRRQNLPRLNPEGRILVRSFGCIIQNHGETHARFRKAGLRSFGGVALINLADGKMLLEHALPHVIVFGAVLQYHFRLDADFFRKGVVNRGLRPLMALPGPVVHMDASSFPGDSLRVKLFVQFA